MVCIIASYLLSEMHENADKELVREPRKNMIDQEKGIRGNRARGLEMSLGECTWKRAYLKYPP